MTAKTQKQDEYDFYLNALTAGVLIITGFFTFAEKFLFFQS